MVSFVYSISSEPKLCLECHRHSINTSGKNLSEGSISQERVTLSHQGGKGGPQGPHLS